MSAGRITRESIDRLRTHINVQEYLAGYLELKRSGAHFVAKCPFHADSSPSFCVYPDHYYCFGCHARGDAIEFEMHKTGKNFSEAVEGLAEKYRVELNFEHGSKVDDASTLQRKKYLHILEEVAAHYHRVLLSQEGAEARAYLAKRGIGPQQVATWRLGFSPLTHSVVKLAEVRGWNLADLKALDLIRVSAEGGRLYDFFRGRIMIPVRDERGQTIAFGGRLFVGDVKSHKYLNSSTSDTFHKSNTLFNLDKARSAIVQKKEVVVVEGYMDCMSLVNAGVQNVVAVLGTALTEEHVKKLARLTNNVTLCFDTDSAGRNAALKSFVLAYPLNLVNLNYVSVPDGKDPDDFVRAHGVEAFHKILAAPQSLTLKAAEILTDKYVGKESKVRVLKSDLVPVIMRHPDPAIREVSLDVLAAYFGLSSGRALAAAGQNFQGKKPFATPAPQNNAQVPQSSVQSQRSENTELSVSSQPHTTRLPVWPVYSVDELRLVLSLMFILPQDLPERLQAYVFEQSCEEELDKRGTERLFTADFLSPVTLLMCEEIFLFWRAVGKNSLFSAGRTEDNWNTLSDHLKLALALAHNDMPTAETLGLAGYSAARSGASQRNQGLVQLGNVFVPANIPYVRFLMKDLEISGPSQLSKKAGDHLFKLEIAYLDRDLAKVTDLLQGAEKVSTEVGSVQIYEERRKLIAQERARRWAKFHS